MRSGRSSQPEAEPSPGLTLQFVVSTLRIVVSDPLLALVTSAARAKVLTVFFGRPGASYYQQQVAREARVPLRAVQRELKRLVEAQILHSADVSGRRVYEANVSSSIYPEIFGLIQKLRGAGPTLERAIRGEDVRLAWIFGSFAKANAGAESDIDLVVIGSVSPRRVRDRLDSAERALRRSVNEHVLTALIEPEPSRAVKPSARARTGSRSPKPCDTERHGAFGRAGPTRPGLSGRRR